MRASERGDDYRANPEGAYLAFPSGMVFCARPALWGFSIWGRPTPAEVDEMLPFIELQLGPSVPRHAVLIDVGHLQDAEAASVTQLARFLQVHADAIEERILQAAVVRPGGLLGMLVAGFPQVVGVRCPVSMFEEFAGAAEGVDGRDVVAALAAAGEEARASITLARLREWLDANIDSATLESAARAAGRAPRSLQRDLRRAKSCFQRELLIARIRCAQRLLAGTERTLSEIAHDVGCASPQHFSLLFRRVSGMTPSGWRTLHRNR